MNNISFSLVLLLAGGAAFAVGCRKRESSDPSTSTQSVKTDLALASQSQDSAAVGSVTDAKIVQADVRRIINALYGNDLDTVLAHTHPKIIASMGGLTAARSAVQTSLAQIQSAQMSLESLSFPQEPSFLKVGLRDFVILPTKSVIVVKGQRMESLNFQFGIKEPGSTNWAYIEGSRINTQNLASLFPDFPAGYKFPPFYRKRL